MARRIGFGTRRRRDKPADAEPAGRRGKLIPAILLLIPLGFALLGVWLLVDAVRFIGVAVPSEGKVISVEADSSGDGVTYTPTIRYTGQDGVTRDAPTHVSSSGYDYRLGTRVDILYDPSEPDEVRIDSVVSLWALPLGFTILGSLLFAFFFGAMLSSGGKAGTAEPDGEADAS